MSSTREFTLSDVAEHTKTDLYVAIHDGVYDVTKFVDEHPGGEEVITDIAGQDATEAFEDVGHSDEAREILKKYLVGSLKPDATAHPASATAGTTRTTTATTTPPKAGASQGPALGGFAMYALLMMGLATAWGIYRFMGAQAGHEQPL